MVLIITSFPIFLLAAFRAAKNNAEPQQIAAVFIGCLLVGFYLLYLRLELLISYLRHFSYAGCSKITTFCLLYTSPILLLLIASAPTIIDIAGWRGVAAAWLVPICYMVVLNLFWLPYYVTLIFTYSYIS